MSWAVALHFVSGFAHPYPYLGSRSVLLFPPAIPAAVRRCVLLRGRVGLMHSNVIKHDDDALVLLPSARASLRTDPVYDRPGFGVRARLVAAFKY